MASLTFTDVSKRYPDGTLALSHVDLAVSDGEFVVLVGPSGCGKSTLLRSAAGLEELSTGDVLLGDKVVTHTDPGARDIAMVFQNYALYPHMTVAQNMAFALKQRKIPPAEITRRVEDAAKTLALTPYLHRKPSALSGGQRQRVAMGRAIVREPACFLLDEPLSNLDAALRVQMRSELRLINQRLGVTTLYVTHDQVEAMTMGDRVAVLSPVSSESECNLQQFATPAELYHRPANRFVAGFIGSPAMNFIRSRLVRHDGRIAAQPAGTTSLLPFPPDRDTVLAPYLEREVTLGVRPEDFTTAATAGLVEATVLVTEMTGPDAYIHFDLPGTPPGHAALVDDTHRVIARVEPR
ncbi:MAG: ABC transporter ATP-binding protein, partial [Parvibaculaceae bacterium]